MNEETVVRYNTLLDRAVDIFIKSNNITEEELIKNGKKICFTGSCNEEYWYKDIMITKLVVQQFEDKWTFHLVAPRYIIEQLKNEQDVKVNE